MIFRGACFELSNFGSCPGKSGVAHGSAWLTESCPPLAFEVAAAILSVASSSLTSKPACCMKNAVVTPITPPPTMVTFFARGELVLAVGALAKGLLIIESAA